MRILTINRDDLVPGSDNSRYSYKFPTNTQFEKGDHVSLGFLNIKNSIPTIADYFYNNTFSYTWYDALDAPVVFNVTIPTGTYSVIDLNFFLQQTMIQNNHYLVDDNGNYVYYLEFQPNDTYLGVQFNAYPIPTSLPVGWTNPAGTILPLTSKCPTITIGEEFGKILGFNVGTYPSVLTITNYSKFSDFTPVRPVNTLIVTCNLVRNFFARPQTQLFAFPIDSENYTLSVDQYQTNIVFNEIIPGYYTSLDISVVDEKLRPIRILDEYGLVEVIIWREKEDGILNK